MPDLGSTDSSEEDTHNADDSVCIPSSCSTQKNTRRTTMKGGLTYVSSTYAFSLHDADAEIIQTAERKG
jgi:hypothetical protein